MSASDLEHAMTTVEIAAAVVVRKLNGKTATDLIVWTSELLASEVGPDISFLLEGLEDFD